MDGGQDHRSHQLLLRHGQTGYILPLNVRFLRNNGLGQLALQFVVVVVATATLGFRRLLYL